MDAQQMWFPAIRQTDRQGCNTWCRLCCKYDAVIIFTETTRKWTNV